MFLVKEELTKKKCPEVRILNPAKILGIKNKVGSLEVGKDADIVIWTCDPFKFYSKVEHVSINAKEIQLESE